MYKRLFQLGIVTYIVFIVFSVLFYKERFSYMDGAYFLFMMVRDNDFVQQHFRYSAYFVELLPVLATKAKLALGDVALIYSLSFSLFYFACYLLCGFAFKSYKSAIALLLFNIIFATHTFFWLISELPQGIAFSILFFAYLQRTDKKIFSPIKFLVTVLCVAIIVFYHPLMVFPLTFIALFFLVRQEREIDRPTLFFLFTCFIIIYIIKKFLFVEAYESQAMGGLKNIVTLFPHYINLYSNKHFLKNCIHEYYWIPLLSIMIFIVYLKNKEWKKLAVFVLFTGAYLLFINVCYPDSYTKDFYIENLYLPIGLFIAMPFVYDVIPVLQKYRLSVAIVFLVLVTGCIRIYKVHSFYTGRLNWERNFLNANADKKLIVDANKTPLDTLLLTWPSPYEFWFISTAEHNKTASIVITDDIKTMEGYKDVKDKFMGAWGPEPYSQFKRPYFVFTDTSTTYTVIK